MANTSPRSPQLLDVQHYITDLTDKVSHATTRITIMSMILIDDRSTHTLVEALYEAAARGVVVSIAADTFTYSELSDSTISSLRIFKTPTRKTTALAARFKELGASFVWLGDVYKFNPLSGVTHLKWSVVDDICYIFGGVNLYTRGIESVDYMLRFHDHLLADQITHQQTLIIQQELSSDIYTGLRADCAVGTFYIDSGARRESLIYTRACELAAEATNILFVSQYCPSGPLTTLLKQTKSDLYFNTPRNALFHDAMMLRWDTFRENVTSRYTRDIYLHAKFIIFTMPGGKKIAITGSHNFAHAGVVFGTREVALETEDPAIITQLQTFFKTHVS